MIRHLHVEQYRSIKFLDVPLGSVRLLIGANASGKSNVVDALKVMQEVVESDVESAVSRRGGMDSLLYRGRRWGSKFNIAIRDHSTWTTKLYLNYHLQVEVAEGHPILDEEFLSEEDEKTAHRFIFMARRGVARLPGQRKALFDTGDPGMPGLGIAASLKLHPRVRRLRNFIRSWQFLQPDLVALRRPQRSERALRLHGDAANLANVLHTLATTNDEVLRLIQTDIAELLKHVRRLSTGVDRGLTSLVMKEQHFDGGFDVTSISDGTLRLIALVTAIHTLPEPGLLCIEEPEHGLHPHILKPFMAFVRQSFPEKGRRQILLTTHSPDLVDAARPEEVLPIERDDEGATKIKSLDQKQLKKWLQEFRLGELWRMRQIGAVP